MMKRIIGVVLFVSVAVQASEQPVCMFCGIEPVRTAQAQTVIVQDMARIMARQRIVWACATAAALGLSAAVFYEWVRTWHRDMPVSTVPATGAPAGNAGAPSGTGSGAPVGNPAPCASGAQGGGAGAPTGSGVDTSSGGGQVTPIPSGFVTRFMRWVGGSVASNIKNTVSFIPTGIALSLSGHLVARIITAYDRLQRPTLGWEWMINEYTHLREQVDQLKYLCATLDAYSPVLEPCNHIVIQAPADGYGVQAWIQQEEVPFFTVRELLQLKLAALKGEHDQNDEPAIARYCVQLGKRWESIVHAIEYCLAYSAWCKQQKHRDATPFDYNQLALFEEELIARTNAVAQQLTTMSCSLNSALRTRTSIGLLAVIYEYSNWVQHHCAVLGYNAVLQA